MAEWHPEKNSGLDPATVTRGSDRRVWWLCGKCSGEWTAKVGTRTHLSAGCPFCSGRRAIPGETDLASQRPDLAAEWSPENDRSTGEVSVGSKYRAIWVCSEHGHAWMAIVSNRTRGGGCPYCANRKVLQGFNDLTTTHPELSKEWSPRNEFGPETVTAGSDKQVIWVCNEYGHEWVAKMQTRSRGRGCPVCSNRAVLPGFNDLATTHPDLAAEWSAKNAFGPESVTAGSTKKIWWRCTEVGHDWLEKARRRAFRGFGCPICSGHRIEPGFNDLASTHPKLAAEWSPRNDFGPDSVSRGSSRRVWWVCIAGHAWRAEIRARTGLGSGCPKCCLNQTSKIEGELHRLLSEHFTGAEQGVRVGRWSVDVFLRKVRVVVEYDGAYFHKDRVEHDTQKTLDLLTRGHGVVRVREWGREYTLPPLEVNDPHYLELTYDYSPDWSGLSDVVDQITSWITDLTD